MKKQMIAFTFATLLALPTYGQAKPTDETSKVEHLLQQLIERVDELTSRVGELEGAVGSLPAEVRAIDLELEEVANAAAGNTRRLDWIEDHIFGGGGWRSEARATRAEELAWRQFWPVGDDEIDLVMVLLEDNCYDTGTAKLSRWEEHGEPFPSWVIVARKLSGCSSGAQAADFEGELRKFLRGN